MASTIFDPLGFLSPVILHPKLLLQRLTREKLDWDETIDENAKNIWDRWYSTLTSLSEITIPRCVTLGLHDDMKKELHIFCDASQYAYAAVAYIKVTDKEDTSRTSIVMAKSRVAPQATIPRLELSAAVIGVRIYEKIIDELSLTDTTAYFWTDSMVILR